MQSITGFTQKAENLIVWVRLDAAWVYTHNAGRASPLPLGEGKG